MLIIRGTAVYDVNLKGLGANRERCGLLDESHFRRVERFTPTDLAGIFGDEIAESPPDCRALIDPGKQSPVRDSRAPLPVSNYPATRDCHSVCRLLLFR